MPATTALPPRSMRSDAPSLVTVRERLGRVAQAMRERGVPVPDLDGKLLRPLLAYALVPPDRRTRLDDRFWLGALAIQMVHEASLLHDDIIDDAGERRGAPTLNATAGVGPALVLGDHYLTGAYRAALATGSAEFLKRFIVAVERTVAGEVRQAQGAGAPVDLATYFEVVLGKSGELLGAAACLGAAVLDLDGIEERASLGRQIGALYQQIDDVLDYCTLAETGKESLKDYRQRKWTWLLEVADVRNFDLSDDEVLEAVFGRASHGISAAERALRALEIRRDGLLRATRSLGSDDEMVGDVVDSWLQAARSAVERQLARRTSAAGSEWPRLSAPPTRAQTVRPSPEAQVVAAARAVGGADAWSRYFSEHARTFSLAARLFPADQRASVAALYAFCRFTDDLVDRPPAALSPSEVAARLEAWSTIAHEAFQERGTGVAFLDRTMADAREAGVEWLYPEALLRGAAMDLEPRGYASWSDLRSYTFCVAGAVGGWMSRLFGVRDPAVLDRAHALGHAMQLTNILRDVGEDLGRGRLYLPQSLLRRHGLTPFDLQHSLTWDTPLPGDWPAAMEELMALADEHYALAREGMTALPSSFRPPVAAAAEAYRGIHREIRRNDYDNLRRRAQTSLPRKLYLGVRGVLLVRRAGAVGIEPRPVARLVS